MADLIDYFAHGQADRVDHPVRRVDQRSRASSCRPRGRSRGKKPIIAYKAGRFAESAQGGGLAHGGDGRRRQRCTRPPSRAPASCASSRSTTCSTVPNCWPGTKTPQGRAAGDRHQRRRPGRDGDRRAARTATACWPSCPTETIDEARTSSFRRPGRTATRSTCWATRRPSGLRKAVEIVLDGLGRRRRAGDPDAAGDDRPDRRGQGRDRRRPKHSTSRCWRPGWAAARSREGIQLFNEAGIPTYSSPGEGRARVHVPGLVRPQPRDAVRDAARHPGRVPAGPRASCARCSTRS